jgi:hypothetical protein
VKVQEPEAKEPKSIIKCEVVLANDEGFEPTYFDAKFTFDPETGECHRAVPKASEAFKPAKDPKNPEVSLNHDS